MTSIWWGWIDRIKTNCLICNENHCILNGSPSPRQKAQIIEIYSGIGCRYGVDYKMKMNESKGLG